MSSRIPLAKKKQKGYITFIILHSFRCGHLSYKIPYVIVDIFRKKKDNSMDEQILKSKKIAELKQVAAAFGIEGAEKMKKQQIIDALL